MIARTRILRSASYARRQGEKTNAYSSSSSSLLMLKYRSSYVVLFGATTWRKSRRFCFFRYFFVRYFRYRLEKAMSVVTHTLLFSRVTLTASPRLPVLPLTLMRSWKYFSSCATSMMLSSTGWWQSTKNLLVTFFTFWPLTAFFATAPFAMVTVTRHARALSQ